MDIFSVIYWASYKQSNSFILWKRISTNNFGQGLVVISQKIGSNVVPRNGVTITHGKDSLCPIIGDNVELGANSVIIGKIKIANGAKIGPNSNDQCK